MSNITLREYYKEVETLVAQGRLDEVVAHCRHILKFFPKDVATYRLLGKSYLESRRLSDATDLLQRVLSVVPDDFVSHVGMSLIREDEGNLDGAIWHMERAFEVQPSNSAIRDEVRRLFGRRDGMEPPKIRLTRGALARMYANGNLFQQSISELRSALAEEPQRFDLLVLLTRMYYLNGQHVDAAEVCNNLLNKLPFCLDANRILAAVLVNSGRESEAEVYNERLQVLDPYSQHSPAGSLDSDLASDTAITLPHLEWEPGQEVPSTDSHPSWASSLGIDLGDSASEEEKLPEWLQEEDPDSGADFLGDLDAGPAAAMAAGIVAREAFDNDEEGGRFQSPEMTSFEDHPAGMEMTEDRPEDLIPDWMKDSGWATAGSEGETPTAEEMSDVLGEPEGAQQAEGDEMPEWLRDIAPGSLESQPQVDLAEEEMSGEIPAWLSSQPPGHSDSVVMWLQEHPDADELPKTGPLPSLDSESGEEVPDWLDSVVASMAATGAAEVLEEHFEREAEGPESEMMEASGPPTSDWLVAEEAAAPINPEEDTRPRGTGTLTPPEDTAPAPVDIFAAETDYDEIPGFKPEESSGINWSFEQPEGEIEAEPALDQADEEDLPEWLSGSGSGEHEVSFEQMADETGPDKESVPEWLSDLEREAEEFSEDYPRETTAYEEPSSAPVMNSNPDLPPWIAAAGLALGAAATAAPDDTEKISDEPSDAREAPPAFGAAAAATPADAEAISDEPASGWEAAPTFDSGQPGETAEPALAGEWAATDPAPPSDADQDAALAWLENLARKQGVDEEELVTSPEDRGESPPDWVVESMGQYDEAGSLPMESPHAESPSLETPAEWAIETMDTDAELEDEQPPWAMATVASLPKVEQAPDWATDTMHTDSDESPEGPLPDWTAGAAPETGEGSPESLPSWATDTMTSETRASDLEWGESSAQSGELQPEQAEASEQHETAEENDWMRETMIPQTDQLEGTDVPVVPLAAAGIAAMRGEPESTSDWMVETALPDMDSMPPGLEGDFPDLETAQTEGDATPERAGEWMLDTTTPGEFEGDAAAEDRWPPENDEEPSWMASAVAGAAAMAAVEDKAPESEPQADWMVETAIPDAAALEDLRIDEAVVFEPSASDEDLYEPVPYAEAAHVLEEEQAAEITEADLMERADEEAEPGTAEDPYQGVLAQAQQSLSGGDLQEALASYNKLIRSRKHLDRIIPDLEEAVYRYPVDTNILETLGDAYAGSNRLQDALDAYTKAEELLR